MNEELSTADLARRRREDENVGAGASDDRSGNPPPAGSLADRPGSVDEDAVTPERSALLPPEDCDRFRGRWGDVQTHFVDGPREAVQDADALVAELMQHLAETFASEREALERQWTRGEDVSTEHLRIALTRYRSFFDRLLEA
jgi:hypothetical protein